MTPPDRMNPQVGWRPRSRLHHIVRAVAPGDALAADIDMIIRSERRVPTQQR